MSILDPELVAAEVAKAVGLAEGPAGVRAVLREIARGAGSTRAVGRAAGLPLPVVAAIQGELRTHGVLTQDRPSRLTERFTVRVLPSGGGATLETITEVTPVLPTRPC